MQMGFTTGKVAVYNYSYNINVERVSTVNADVWNFLVEAESSLKQIH